MGIRKVHLDKKIIDDFKIPVSVSRDKRLRYYWDPKSDKIFSISNPNLKYIRRYSVYVIPLTVLSILFRQSNQVNVVYFYKLAGTIILSVLFLLSPIFSERLNNRQQDKEFILVDDPPSSLEDMVDSGLFYQNIELGIMIFCFGCAFVACSIFIESSQLSALVAFIIFGYGFSYFWMGYKLIRRNKKALKERINAE